MSGKADIYWPVFMAVAVISTAAVWRFAPHAPIPESMRSWCVELRRCVTGQPAPEPPAAEETSAVPETPAASESSAVVGRPAPRPPQRRVEDNAPHQPTPNPPAVSEPSALPEPPVVSEPSAVVGRPAPRPPQRRVEDNAPHPGQPQDKKARYDELTKRIEARRHEILRQNISQSPEGRKALAALEAFKKLGAEVEELKKKYGETDSRVMSRRGDLLKRKDEVRRTSEAYKKWKERHPDKILMPEDDPAYRELIAERQLLL